VEDNTLPSPKYNHDQNLRPSTNNSIGSKDYHSDRNNEFCQTSLLCETRHSSFQPSQSDFVQKKSPDSQYSTTRHKQTSFVHNEQIRYKTEAHQQHSRHGFPPSNHSLTCFAENNTMVKLNSAMENTPRSKLLRENNNNEHMMYLNNHDDLREEQSTVESEHVQTEVAYVLAKQYKSPKSGNLLGFPAYNTAKSLLGFYRESSTNVAVGQFTPITRLEHQFGATEQSQASRHLSDVIENTSKTLYVVNDWGSVASLIDHALVYDWSRSLMREGYHS